MLYCLICKKSQTNLENHLRKVCLVEADDARIQEELSKARQSNDTWSRDGRVLNLFTIRKLVEDDPTCDLLAKHLQSKGLLIAEDSPVSSDTQVLALAEKDMAEVIDGLRKQKRVPPKTQAELKNFCVATLMWVHHLGPTNVKELKVQEWNDRVTEGDRIVLKLARGSVSLSPKEESWMDCYFMHVRPQYVKAQESGAKDQDCFFLGMSGLPLSNPTTDVQRLRTRYVKRLRETAAPPPDTQGGAEAHPTGQEMPPQSSSPASPVAESPTPRFWGAFQDLFPVTLNATPPGKGEAREAGFGERRYYHHWRRLQYKLRTSYILEQSIDRTGQRPSPARIQRSLTRETTWGTNVPSVDSVLSAWQSCQDSSTRIDDPAMIACVTLQTWRGLAIKQFQEKGKGVIATIQFRKDQVVCDYHGEVISKQEGERRLETLTEEPSYLFFFKSKGGEPLCIDAQKWPCECHPGKEIFGRRLNHSRKVNNIRPQRVRLNFPDGPRDCVLFLAMRDIAVGEELLWDYGVRPSSFGGEGRDLQWLNE